MTNGVTNTQLFDAITDLRREIKSDIAAVSNEVKCVDQRIDNLVEARGDLKAEVAELKVQTENLSKRVGVWDIGNSLGVVVAAILAIFGIRT